MFKGRSDGPLRPRAAGYGQYFDDVGVIRATRIWHSKALAARIATSAITVSDALRAQIDAVIAETGYVPNRAARALACARSDSVAGLVPSLSNMVFIEILAGIHDVLQSHGYHTLIGDTSYSALVTPSYCQKIGTCQGLLPGPIRKIRNTPLETICGPNQ